MICADPSRLADTQRRDPCARGSPAARGQPRTSDARYLHRERPLPVTAARADQAVPAPPRVGSLPARTNNSGGGSAAEVCVACTPKAAAPSWRVADRVLAQPRAIIEAEPCKASYVLTTV